LIANGSDLVGIRQCEDNSDLISIRSWLMLICGESHKSCSLCSSIPWKWWLSYGRPLNIAVALLQVSST